MAAWTGQPNTVSLAWTTNLKGAYYKNRKLGVAFGQSWSEKSAILVNSLVYVRGDRKCPGGNGTLKLIRIPGTIKYHAYSSANFGTLRDGKLLTPGKTWAQCGVGQGMWYITATFTPEKCWRDTGIRTTRAIIPSVWVCNPCTVSWPQSCPCG